MPCSHTQICICIPKVVTGYIQSSIGNTGYITDIGWGIINGTVFRLRSQLVRSKIDWATLGILVLCQSAHMVEQQNISKHS